MHRIVLPYGRVGGVQVRRADPPVEHVMVLDHGGRLPRLAARHDPREVVRGDLGTVAASAAAAAVAVAAVVTGEEEGGEREGVFEDAAWKGESVWAVVFLALLAEWHF